MYKISFPARRDADNDQLVNISLPFPCEVHLNYPRFKKWQKPFRKIKNKKFRVLTHYTEAIPLKSGRENLFKFADCFDLILTNEEDLFEMDNVYPEICLFGGNVPSLSPRNPPSSKEFSVSNLYSAGTTSALKIADSNFFEGYEIRKIIWKKKEQIKIPKRFYTSSFREPNVEDLNPYNFELKDEIMKSMFSLVIENSIEENFFSEKLLDCLRTYTIPIYFGCKNIGKYFDIRGMIIPNNIDDAIAKINNLDKNSYSLMSKFVARNFLLAAKYTSHANLMTKYIIDGKNWLENKV